MHICRELDPPILDSPESELWLAVLFRAYWDATRTCQSGGLSAMEVSYFSQSVIVWFFTKARYVGSFEWIVDHLFEDPSDVKRRIRNNLKKLGVTRKCFL